MLWTFKDISFLPHCLVSDNDAENVPIVIGPGNKMGNQIPDHTPIMINLADQIPQESGKIKRILEIVAGSESERQQARKRYAEYRDQGHVLNKHDIYLAMGKGNQSGESSSSEIPEISHSVISKDDITESIDELEELIVETKLPPKLYPEIPVLNDAVDPVEARRYAQSETSTESTNGHEDKIEDFPSDRLKELVDKVDRNLSKELDSLVDILKDTIKDSIINELKELLKKEAHQIESPSSREDTPD